MKVNGEQVSGTDWDQLSGAVGPGKPECLKSGVQEIHHTTRGIFQQHEFSMELFFLSTRLGGQSRSPFVHYPTDQYYHQGHRTVSFLGKKNDFRHHDFPYW